MRMTRAESDYGAVLDLIAGVPKRLRQQVQDRLEDLLDEIAEKIVRQRNPRTLDDVRAWGAGEHLAESAIFWMIDQYADQKYGYDKYAMLPCDKWPADAWCPDGYCEDVSNRGSLNILADESLHTIEDLVRKLDEEYGISEQEDRLRSMPCADALQ